MTIREHAREWPPQVTGGVGDAAIADPTDKLLNAQRHAGVITLKLRKKDGIEYTMVLVLPSHLYGMAIVAIVLAKELTLGELGELGF